MFSKFLLRITSLILLVVFPLTAIARECDRDEYDKAEYLSERAGAMLVEKLGGGKDKRVSVSSCEYNSYSGIFKTRIDVYWNGIFFSDNHYNIAGELKMNSNGSGVEFSRNYANEAVESLEMWGLLAGVVVLGVVASQPNK